MKMRTRTGSALWSICLMVAGLATACDDGLSPFVVQVAGMKGERLCVVSEELRELGFQSKSGCYLVDASFDPMPKEGECISAKFPSLLRNPNFRAAKFKKMTRECDIPTAEFEAISAVLLKG